jgi:predicted dehydrogenase
VTRLKVGVIGVGALGQHHARVYADLPEAELAGVVDLHAERAAAVAQQHGARVFPSAEALAEAVDAVSVAVPTVDHHRIARPFLAAGKGVLVEKPMTITLEQADDLIAAAKSGNAVLQVGHVERFNPAVDVLRAVALKPRFIEVHRLGSFSPRSLDIDVVLDLMIHDLDIVLAMDGSPAVQVDAVGVPVRIRPHRQRHRQPRLRREGPQVPRLRRAVVRVGGLHSAGDAGLPPGARCLRASRNLHRPHGGAGRRAAEAAAGRVRPGRSRRHRARGLG